MLELPDTGPQLVALADGTIAFRAKLLDLFLPLVDAGLRLLLPGLAFDEIGFRLAEPRHQGDPLRFGQAQRSLRVVERLGQLTDPIGFDLFGDHDLTLHLVAQ